MCLANLSNRIELAHQFWTSDGLYDLLMLSLLVITNILLVVVFVLVVVDTTRQLCLEQSEDTQEHFRR